jgi:hypothetical protein
MTLRTHELFLYEDTDYITNSLPKNVLKVTTPYLMLCTELFIKIFPIVSIYLLHLRHIQRRR